MPVKILVDLINKRKGVLGGLVKKITIGLMERTTLVRLNLFENKLIGNKILDVGLGTGSMAKILLDRKFDVRSIDVTNTSLYSEIDPIIYDGENIPMATKSCDTGLLICVLHHCSNPMKVLEETMRVCKRVIIIEDTYRNDLEKMLISARDNIGNFEFFQHQYHKTKEWERIFKNMGWQTLYVKEWSSVTFYAMYGRQTLFVIE